MKFQDSSIHPSSVTSIRIAKKYDEQMDKCLLKIFPVGGHNENAIYHKQFGMAL